MGIVIVGDKIVEARFKAMARRIRNRRPLFKRIGIKLLNEINEGFEQEKNDGKSWTPLALKTIEQRRKAGKGAMILQDTGRLKGSYTSQFNNNTLRVGTNVEYAPTHEFGTNNIPKRQMLPSREVTLGIALSVTEGFIREAKFKSGL